MTSWKKFISKNENMSCETAATLVRMGNAGQHSHHYSSDFTLTGLLQLLKCFCTVTTKTTAEQHLYVYFP